MNYTYLILSSTPQLDWASQLLHPPYTGGSIALLWTPIDSPPPDHGGAEDQVIKWFLLSTKQKQAIIRLQSGHSLTERDFFLCSWTLGFKARITPVHLHFHAFSPMHLHALTLKSMRPKIHCCTKSAWIFSQVTQKSLHIEQAPLTNRCEWLVSQSTHDGGLVWEYSYNWCPAVIITHNRCLGGQPRTAGVGLCVVTMQETAYSFFTVCSILCTIVIKWHVIQRVATTNPP